MRHIQRLIAASVLVALCGTLSSCGGGNSASSFDPMDMLDFLDQKKPLQGTRKPVFPDGVPGVAQGVPKELYKGNQAQQQDVPPVTAPPPAPEPKAKRGKKSAPAQPAAAPAEPEASPDSDAPAEDAAPTAPPTPKTTKRKRTSPTALPREDAAPAAAPAQQQPAPQQQQPQQQMAPFPAPMPSGSFQR
ncbi:MAG TPA: hypothetical protein VGC86_05255 [Afipia sp.]